MQLQALFLEFTGGWWIGRIVACTLGLAGAVLMAALVRRLPTLLRAA